MDTGRLTSTYKPAGRRGHYVATIQYIDGITGYQASLFYEHPDLPTEWAADDDTPIETTNTPTLHEAIQAIERSRKVRE